MCKCTPDIRVVHYCLREDCKPPENQVFSTFNGVFIGKQYYVVIEKEFYTMEELSDSWVFKSKQ